MTGAAYLCRPAHNPDACCSMEHFAGTGMSQTPSAALHWRLGYLTRPCLGKRQGRLGSKSAQEGCVKPAVGYGLLSRGSHGGLQNTKCMVLLA